MTKTYLKQQVKEVKSTNKGIKKRIFNGKLKDLVAGIGKDHALPHLFNNLGYWHRSYHVII